MTSGLLVVSSPSTAFFTFGEYHIVTAKGIIDAQEISQMAASFCQFNSVLISNTSSLYSIYTSRKQMIIVLCFVSEGTIKKGIVNFPEVQSFGKQWGLKTGLIATKTVTVSRASRGFAVDSEDGTNKSQVEQGPGRVAFLILCEGTGKTINKGSLFHGNQIQHGGIELRLT